jgi:hypothetical protein
VKNDLSNTGFFVAAAFATICFACGILREWLNSKIVRRAGINLKGFNQPWKKAAEVEMARRALQDGPMRKFLEVVDIAILIALCGFSISLIFAFRPR